MMRHLTHGGLLRSNAPVRVASADSIEPTAITHITLRDAAKQDLRESALVKLVELANDKALQNGGVGVQDLSDTRIVKDK
jgi:hypothetical protein